MKIRDRASERRLDLVKLKLHQNYPSQQRAKQHENKNIINTLL